MIGDSNARRQYKANARADIRTQFWLTIETALFRLMPIILIVVLVHIGVQSIADEQITVRLYQYLGICTATVFFIGSPIVFGAKHYFVALARGEACSPSQVFTCFTSSKKYLTSLKLSLCIGVRSLGWLLLGDMLIIVFLFFLIGCTLDLSRVIYALGRLAFFELSAVAILFILVKVRRYDGAYINMIDMPDASVWQAVKACAPIFKGHNWELLVFDLSFILWQLASAITFGIVGIYVTAYTEIAFVHYFDDLCGRKAELTQPSMRDTEL